MELLTEHEHRFVRVRHTAHEPVPRHRRPLCLACVEQRQSAFLAPAQEQSEAEWQQAWLDARLELCPEDYRSTNWRDHPELSPSCRWLAKYWWLRNDERDALVDAEGCRCLALSWGWACSAFGRGKTRAMYAILKRLHWAGVRCFAVQAIHFAEAAMLVAERAPWAERYPALSLLKRCHTVPVLLFDDLAKKTHLH